MKIEACEIGEGAIIAIAHCEIKGEIPAGTTDKLTGGAWRYMPSGSSESVSVAEAAAARAKDGPGPTGWVDVKERLPDDDVDVVAFFEFGHRLEVSKIRKIDGEPWWWTRDEDLPIESVTHWMPVPDAPKAEDSVEGEEHE
jgi:hypothetical protein